MAYFNVCRECGASLEPNEKCDYEGVNEMKKEIEQMTTAEAIRELKRLCPGLCVTLINEEQAKNIVADECTLVTTIEACEKNILKALHYIKDNNIETA